MEQTDRRILSAQPLILYKIVTPLAVSLVLSSVGAALLYDFNPVGLLPLVMLAGLVPPLWDQAISLKAVTADTDELIVSDLLQEFRLPYDEILRVELRVESNRTIHNVVEITPRDTAWYGRRIVFEAAEFDGCEFVDRERRALPIVQWLQGRIAGKTLHPLSGTRPPLLDQPIRTVAAIDSIAALLVGLAAGFVFIAWFRTTPVLARLLPSTLAIYALLLAGAAVGLQRREAWGYALSRICGMYGLLLCIGLGWLVDVLAPLPLLPLVVANTLVIRPSVAAELTDGVRPALPVVELAIAAGALASAYYVL